MAATLLVAYKTPSVITGYKVNLVFGGGKNLLLGGRDYRIYNRNGYSALCGVLKACSLNIIKHYRGFACAVNGDTAVDNLTQLLFAHLILNNIVIAFDMVRFRVLNRKGPLKVKLVCRVTSVNKA